MVGALDRGDAVDLDEAQTLDQPCKIFTFRRAPRPCRSRNSFRAARLERRGGFVKLTGFTPKSR